MFIKTTIAIGSDHGGYDLKSALIPFLEAKGLTVIDAGCDSSASVDYPQYGKKVAQLVVEGKAETGVVICGTGIGISIAANKVEGARAALCHSVEYAELTRLHNDANVLALGGRFNTVESAKAIVQKFLSTEFEGGRHQNRVNQL